MDVRVDQAGQDRAAGEIVTSALGLRGSLGDAVDPVAGDVHLRPMASRAAGAVPEAVRGDDVGVHGESRTIRYNLCRSPPAGTQRLSRRAEAGLPFREIRETAS